MERLLINIVYSVLGSVVTVACHNIWLFWQSRCGKYTGIWTQKINTNDGTSKVDIVNLKHNKLSDRLKGTIVRRNPSNQNKKKWDVEGIVVGNMLYLIYKSCNIEINPSSFGTIHLHNINDNELSGYYYKGQIKSREDSYVYSLEKISLTWKREKKCLNI